MASTRWYFAEGNTSKDAVYLLSLFNPFPEDAIADLSFTTDQGRAVPDAFQGLVVPARGLIVVNVGDHVRRRDEVSTTVAVRSGRLVAGKLQTHNGGGHKGIALVPGAPQLGKTWYFPDGFFSDGVAERFHVYNPGSKEATVTLDLALEQGAAEPFDITVPPQGRFTLTTSGESRIPKGDAHAVTAQSTNGVPVVIERTIDSASPAPRQGYTDLLGAQAAATDWVLAAGGTTETFDEWVVVLNTGRRTAHVSFSALASGQTLALEGLQDEDVPPGQRRAFRIGDHVKRPDLPMLIESDAPVVVERGMFRVGGLGMASAIGIPSANRRPRRPSSCHTPLGPCPPMDSAIVEPKTTAQVDFHSRKQEGVVCLDQTPRRRHVRTTGRREGAPGRMAPRLQRCVHRQRRPGDAAAAGHRRLLRRWRTGLAPSRTLAVAPRIDQGTHGARIHRPVRPRHRVPEW